jgi:hypothetical protein
LSIVLFVLLAAGQMASAALHEYRYIEGEAHSASEGSGLRKEGFTAWMAHPSQGAVVVLGGPGNWLEYEVKGLAARPYSVFVRGLAWATGCAVDVYWDGQRIGPTSYAHPATALRWSREVGVVQGPGDHRLRLVGADGIHQAPYLDAILLTTQEGLQPDDADQDFASFSTALPPLVLAEEAGARALMPQPGEAAATAPIEVRALQAKPPVLGENELRFRLAAAAPEVAELSVRLGDGPVATTEARLAGQGEEEVAMRFRAEQTGPAPLHVAVLAGGGTLASGAYAVTVPAPARVSLDEYAYPLGTTAMTWSAEFAGADPSFAATLVTEVEVRAEGAQAILFGTRRGTGAAAIPLQIPIVGFGPGRYEVVSRFAQQGRTVLTERHTVMIFVPVPFEEWLPVKSTRAQGPVLLLNDRPFLGRLLFHAAPNQSTRAQGFNLVQCFGADPDPLDSIQRHLDQCAQHGLWGMVALFNNRFFLPGPGFDRERLRQAVLRFKDHPALFGWDLIDEPDCREDTTPAEVAECARLVRGLDPNHVVWVNLCRVNRALEWLESQDLWSFDAYPFPVQGFAGYAPWLKLSDESLRGRRPLGTCLQTYQWSAQASLPMPTAEQLRASAWLHILHGYTWFGFYSYYDPEPAGCLARAPELWSYCRALNAELVAMSGVILDPTPFQSLAVEAAAGEVEAGLKPSADAQVVVVVVSGAREPRRVRVTIPGPATEAEVLFDQPRRLSLKDGIVEDILPSYGTLVLKIRQP